MNGSIGRRRWCPAPIWRWLPALTASLLLLACSPRVELLSAVPESEANDIMATLLNNGITVGKSLGKTGASLTVPGDQVSRALDVMRAHGLPRERFTGIGSVFRKDGLISSALEERARYVFALSQELGQTLTQIDGVTTARVHVVLPERGGVNDNSTPATASVFIKFKAGTSLDALTPQIRAMVANGIPGLNAANVTVFMVRAQVSPADDAMPWVNVGGWQVAPDSVQGIRLVIWSAVGAAAVCAAIAGGLGFWCWRLFRAGRARKGDAETEDGVDGKRDRKRDGNGAADSIAPA